MWWLQPLLLSEPRCQAWAEPPPWFYLQPPVLETFSLFPFLLPARVTDQRWHHQAAATGATSTSQGTASAEPLLPCQGFRSAQWADPSVKLQPLKPGIVTTEPHPARLVISLSIPNRCCLRAVSVWFTSLLACSLLQEQRMQNQCLGGFYNWTRNTVFSAEEWTRDKNENEAVGIPESCPTLIFSVVLKKAVIGFLLLVHLWKTGAFLSAKPLELHY